MLNDGDYDSVDRKDEDLIFKRQNIDFSKVMACTDSKGNDGFFCGLQCLANFLWCSHVFTDICNFGDFTLSNNDPDLCKNKQFWQHSEAYFQC